MSSETSKSHENEFWEYDAKLRWIFQHVRLYSNLKDQSVEAVIEVDENVIQSFNDVFGQYAPANVQTNTWTSSNMPPVLREFVEHNMNFLIFFANDELPSKKEIKDLAELFESVSRMTIMGFTGKEWEEVKLLPFDDVGIPRFLDYTYLKYRFFIRNICLEYDVESMHISVHMMRPFSTSTIDGNLSTNPSIAEINKEYLARHLDVENSYYEYPLNVEIHDNLIRDFSDWVEYVRENSVLNLKYESVRHTDIDKNRMANYAKNIPENSSAYKFFVLQEFDKPAIIKKLQCFFGFLPEHHVIPAFKAIEMYTYVIQHKINVGGKIKEYSCQVAIFNPAQIVDKNINNINRVLCGAISHTTGKNFLQISRLFAQSFQDGISPDISWWHLLVHRQITPKTIEALNNYHQQNGKLIFMLDLFNPLILDEQINGFISEAGLKNRFTPQSLAFVENLKPDWYGLIKPEHIELFKGNENINIFYILREIGRKHPEIQNKTFKYHGYLNTFREYAYDILVWLLENKFPSNVIYWFFTKLLDCTALPIKKEYKNQYFKDGKQIDFNKVLSCCFAVPFPHKQKSDYKAHDRFAYRHGEFGLVYRYEEFMQKWLKGRVSFLNQYWKCCSCLTRRKEEQKQEERKNIFGSDIAGLIKKYQQEVDMMFEFVQSEDDLAFAFHKMRHFF